MLDLIQSFFKTLYNVPELIRWGGMFGLILIVFAETGLMIGFFLPGDSLLVTAGLFAAKGDLNIWSGSTSRSSWPPSSGTRSATGSATGRARRSTAGPTRSSSAAST